LSNDSVASHRLRGPLTQVLLTALVILAGTEFLLRGPVRFVRQGHDWNDISQVYGMSEEWLRGKDPYSAKGFVATWETSSGLRVGLEGPRSHVFYPLPAVVVMSPLSLFHWSTAQWVWALIQSLGFLVMIWQLARLPAGLKRWQKYIFIALAFALAPFHTGIATGNVSTLAITLAVVAVTFALAGQDSVSGILLGLSCCLKLQIGFWFAFYYLIRRRKRLAIAAACVFISVAFLGALRLGGDFTWIHHYFQNNRLFFSANRVDDFTEMNPIRFTLVNLQVLIYAFVKNAFAANAVALAIGGVLFALWSWLVWKRQAKETDFLDLSALLILSILPIYHRFYDAGLLILPLYWTFTVRSAALQRLSRAVLVFMLPFLVPGSAALQQWELQGRVPSSIASAWWWQSIVMSHEIWCLLALTLLLLYAVFIEESERESDSPELAPDLLALGEKAAGLPGTPSESS